MTNHLQAVPKLRTCGAIPPFPPHAFTACPKTDSPSSHIMETDFYTTVNFHISSGLWAVLNTAGLCFKGRLEYQENSHWDAMLKYNVVGTLRTARTFLPLLKNKRGKSIHSQLSMNDTPTSDPDFRIYSVSLILVLQMGKRSLIL